MPFCVTRCGARRRVVLLFEDQPLPQAGLAAAVVGGATTPRRSGRRKRPFPLENRPANPPGVSARRIAEWDVADHLRASVRNALLVRRVEGPMAAESSAWQELSVPWHCAQHERRTMRFVRKSFRPTNPVSLAPTISFRTGVSARRVLRPGDCGTPSAAPVHFSPRVAGVRDSAEPAFGSYRRERHAVVVGGEGARPCRPADPQLVAWRLRTRRTQSRPSLRSHRAFVSPTRADCATAKRARSSGADLDDSHASTGRLGSTVHTSCREGDVRTGGRERRAWT
jgi:hypothetical protein